VGRHDHSVLGGEVFRPPGIARAARRFRIWAPMLIGRRLNLNAVQQGVSPWSSRSLMLRASSFAGPQDCGHAAVGWRRARSGEAYGHISTGHRSERSSARRFEIENRAARRSSASDVDVDGPPRATTVRVVTARGPTS